MRRSHDPFAPPAKIGHTEAAVLVVEPVPDAEGIVEQPGEIVATIEPAQPEEPTAAKKAPRRKATRAQLLAELGVE